MIQEVALLAPVVTIFAINVALYLGGERGTLLLPAGEALPAVGFETMPFAKAPEEAIEAPEFVEEMRLAA
ncbi:MAG: hypothetical protein ABI789_12060 [Usitatibacter sp.]